MRKLLCAGVAAGALLSAPYSHGQEAVVCTNCDTLAQQLLAYAEQGLQLNEETVTAVRETTDALPLAQFTFQDFTDDIAQIQGIINTANMLVGQTGQILQNISTLGGYPLGNIPNWHQQITNEANAVGKAFMVCGEVTNILQGIANDARLLTQLVNQVMAAIGHQQSFQTISSQISELGQQIQKIEGGANGCRQGFATYDAAQQDRQYLIHSVGDRDMEATWVQECQKITALGWPLPNWCAGSQ
jgi:hypothetical protein